MQYHHHHSVTYRLSSPAITALCFSIRFRCVFLCTENSLYDFISSNCVDIDNCFWSFPSIFFFVYNPVRSSYFFSFPETPSYRPSDLTWPTKPWLTTMISTGNANRSAISVLQSPSSTQLRGESDDVFSIFRNYIRIDQ